MQERLKALSMQILQTGKMKKIDAYTIFRLLTSKKSKYSVDTSQFNLERLVPYDQLKEFIVKVNPYFDFNSQDKLDYYRNYFVISHDIFDCCVKLLEESEKPSYYKIKDLDRNKFLSFSELDDSNSKDKSMPAKYESVSEVQEKTQIFLNLYKYLKIEKNLEIYVFNSQDQVLEKIKL